MVRQIRAGETGAIALIAARMRDTLVEVVGPAGGEMYTPAWLEDRVRQHVDGRHEGAVFVAEQDGVIVGHCIVRSEAYEERPIGLYATTYVLPSARRRGLATALLDAGERWLLERGHRELHTCTAVDNTGLRTLYAGRGYGMCAQTVDMVRLFRMY